MDDAMSMVRLTLGIWKKSAESAQTPDYSDSCILSRKIQIVILVKPVADCVDSYILTRKKRLLQ